VTPSLIFWSLLGVILIAMVGAWVIDAIVITLLDARDKKEDE
jgi:hypothetical protein